MSNFKPSEITGNALDDYLYSRKESSLIEIKVDKTFSFNEENIRQILADYLKREHQVTVKAEDFKMDIQDGSSGGYYENEYIPAKLNSFSVTVKG